MILHIFCFRLTFSWSVSIFKSETTVNLRD